MSYQQSTILYKKYARPSLGSILENFGADVSYVKAKGSAVFYQNGDQLVEVIDATSGFGSAFFGHNNPVFKARLIEDLSNDLPFVVQGSIRQKSAELCEKLNSMLNAITDQNYISILSNTGAEAVEAALKAACYRDSKRKRKFIKKLSSKIFQLRQKVSRGELRFGDTFKAYFEEAIGEIGNKTGEEILSILDSHIVGTINHPPITISLKNGYHGKSTGALQLTHSHSFRGEFKAFGIRSIFVDPNDEDSLVNTLEKNSIKLPDIKVKDNLIEIEKTDWANVAAMIFEPIQGEGGIREIKEPFLKKAKELSSKHDFLMICDEIQTGVGRTGRLLCSEKYNINFDIYLLGKSLGGGMTKISSVCIDTSAYEEGFDIVHTTTFSEDDISSSVAIEALNTIENTDILHQAREKGDYIRAELEGIAEQYPSVVKEVRGEGLLIGIELVTQETTNSNVIYNLSINKLLGKMIASYVLNRHKVRLAPTISDGDVIRLQPPGLISIEQIDRVLQALKDAFDLIAKADAGNLLAHLISPEKFQVSDRKDYSSANKWLRASDVAHIKKKITFIATPSSSQDIVDIDPSLARFDEAETEKIIEICAAMNMPVRLPGRVMKANGEEAVFYIISVPYTPKMMDKLYAQNALGHMKALIDDLVEEAISRGHSHFGLGSFTSIVTGNGLELKTDKIAITTGNSLTVVSSAEATFSEARSQGIKESHFRLGIIGANGNIGSMYATYASSVCKDMLLIGREGSEQRLRSVANQVYRYALDNPQSCAALNCALAGGISEEKLEAFKAAETHFLYKLITSEMGDGAPVRISTSAESAAQCNIIICTTNSPRKILFPSMVGDHKTIISDVSFPPDVDKTVSQMENVVVLHGGTVDISSVFDDRFRGIPTLGKQEGYACMSETILLGLYGKQEHFSYGKLEIKKLHEIKEQALKFGFVLDKPKQVTNVFG